MELQKILQFLIYLFSFSITMVVGWSFLRRWIHKKQYMHIDRLKSLYQVWIEDVLAGKNSQYITEFQRIVKEDSSGREALEQLICERCMSDDQLIFPLIKEVGFIQLYEKKLISKHLTTVARAYAADRLGRMQSEESVDVLCQVLHEESNNKELANSILKAMALIGNAKALDCIIGIFPLVLKKEIITPKNGEMILLMFASLYHEALVMALRNFHQAGERLSTIVVLDTLSRSEVTSNMVTVAKDMLSTEDVELRVRCLRLIANADAKMATVSFSEIKDYLQDEHWFIRVQAIEVARVFIHEESFSQMVALLGDAHWQVRRAAAGAILSHGDESLETIISVIEGKDIYAKEAICEAIHLEGYVEQLIRHLTLSSLLYNSSARILFYMLSIGLASSLKEMALTYPNDEIRQNLHLLMYPEGSEND